MLRWIAAATNPEVSESAADWKAALGNAPSQLGEVVVTATRIVRNGYQAPTPTSVVTEQEIAAKAPNNIADFVNELPQLVNSATPQNQTNQISSGLSGISALNLRALGENRTLVLLDGERVGPSTTGGLVDIN